MKTGDQETPLAWTTSAEPGAMVVYFTGNLASASDHSDLRHCANEWLALAEKGLVLLSQKRLGPGRYEYRATRTTASMTEARPLREIIVDGQRIVDNMLDIS